MLSGAGGPSPALHPEGRKSSDDRPPCLENPRPAGAESTLTENVASPFQAEPRQDHPEIGAYDRATDAKFGEHQREAETRLSTQEQETQRDADTAFADRARMLIKRGYTPKIAVELVLHEMEFEQGEGVNRTV
jgi:hypothetical protein